MTRLNFQVLLFFQQLFFTVQQHFYCFSKLPSFLWAWFCDDFKKMFAFDHQSACDWRWSRVRILRRCSIDTNVAWTWLWSADMLYSRALKWMSLRKMHRSWFLTSFWYFCYGYRHDRVQGDSLWTGLWLICIPCNQSPYNNNNPPTDFKSIVLHFNRKYGAVEDEDAVSVQRSKYFIV